MPIPLAALAHPALLAKVRRLRGHPWTPQAEGRLIGVDEGSDVDTTAAISRALEQERERLRRHTRRMSELDDDPTPEQIAAFREVSAEISARIHSLEAQLTETGQRVQNVPNLRALHEKLTRTEIPAVVDVLTERGDEVGLRDLVLSLIESATLVERLPGHRSVWARIQAVWAPDVQTLLDVGLLTLDDAVPAPADLLCTEPARQARRARNRDRRSHEQAS